MANFIYLIPPFTSTIFTSPVAGTNDAILASVLADFTINGNGGNDTITTGAGIDVIRVGNGNNTVNAGGGTNTVTSGNGNDTNSTGAGADLVDSGGGRDLINAGGGNDRVNAGAGNDLITPRGGIDSLSGGGGHDAFVYGSLADARLGADTVSDISILNPNVPGEGDMFNFHGLVDDFTGLNGDQLAELVASGHLNFGGNSSNTVISFDSNGSAAGGFSGVLVTVAGVAFSSEAASVLSFADNIFIS
jgi:Ca2+-binding RTX toxin-like protein